jgi:hypothetical protein
MIRSSQKINSISDYHLSLPIITAYFNNSVRKYDHALDGSYF